MKSLISSAAVPAAFDHRCWPSASNRQTGASGLGACSRHVGLGEGQGGSERAREHGPESQT
jgi:hypothetical protein